MLHNLVVTYTVKSLFTDGYYTSHQSLRLNWEGVRKMVADPWFRERGARFELHPYWGQPTDN